MRELTNWTLTRCSALTAPDNSSVPKNPHPFWAVCFEHWVTRVSRVNLEEVWMLGDTGRLVCGADTGAPVAQLTPPLILTAQC